MPEYCFVPAVSGSSGWRLRGWSGVSIVARRTTLLGSCGGSRVAEHFADRLLSRIEEKAAPACVGFDPLVERLPDELLVQFGLAGRGTVGATDEALAQAELSAVEAFGRGVIEAVAEHVPAVKINIAFFEPFGEGGVRAYVGLVRAAHEAGLVVVGDIKRADIGHSAAEYARAHLCGGAGGESDLADAVTVNPYFGIDGVRPFVDAAVANGRGVFVLVQTSNSSAAEIQGVQLADGRSFVERVAELVELWAADGALVGASGYSCVGAVVSPQDLESTRHIRTLMPSCLFLVPGFGAQGRTADEVATCFRSDGTGAVVSASRSVIYAFGEERHRDTGADWKTCVGRACGAFVGQIRQALKRR